MDSSNRTRYRDCWVEKNIQIKLKPDVIHAFPYHSKVSVIKTGIGPATGCMPFQPEGSAFESFHRRTVCPFDYILLMTELHLRVMCIIVQFCEKNWERKINDCTLNTSLGRWNLDRGTFIPNTHQKTCDQLVREGWFASAEYLHHWFCTCMRTHTETHIGRTVR